MSFAEGSRVIWTDPDGGNQKVGTVLEQTDDEEYFVVFTDGSEAGAYEHELKPARFHYTRTVLHKGLLTQTETKTLEGTSAEFLIDTYVGFKRSYSELVEYKNGIVHVAGDTVTIVHAEDDTSDGAVSHDWSDEALATGEFH